MAKPVIFTVDDEQAVLNSVERDLRQKYGREYRILKADSGASALTALKQLQARGEPVALFLTDQRMPQMSGTQFLEQAGAFYPEAKKVLLTAYADTEAAIQSINRVGLDYYLMKPWDPPEENLYPLLDDLLADWKVAAKLPYEGIRVAGAQWSPQSHAVKDFLARHQIAYQWLDVDADDQARLIADEYSTGAAKLPVVIFQDGSVLVEPSLREMADKVGMRTRAESQHYELIIIGAGPAGLSAAVCGASEGHNVLVIERQAPGGQAGNSPKIENYLGFPTGLSGMDLARRAITQARRFGAEILSTTEVVSVRLQDQYRILTLGDGTELTCKALLLASGATFRQLDVPGVKELTGSGVYYGAAYTEAMYYKDQPVFVVGGANSAGQGAMYLSRYASKVTMLIRRDTQWSSRYLVDAEAANPKIERLFNTEVIEVVGEPGRLSHIVVVDNITREARNLQGAAMFIFIGARPNSELVRDLVLTDDKGFIITGPDLVRNGKRPKGWMLDRDPFMLETSVPGIFAAGDVRLGTNHRVASAIGEGGIAIAAIQQYLSTI
ncbi:MAG: fused response regulator/thioredoxin-disulfide reductase [Chloroflexi bacterium RBG_16_58_14]|nr:MAG: fused response regulator/thioredoxin-disulfide reductase [Chloroflexi bacterium RBG_16_58_14]